MKKYLLIPLFLCLSIVAQAQVSSLTGTIYDNATQEPVEMASVRILNQQDSVYVRGASTNKLGQFNIAVNPGKYIVQVTYIGYLEKFTNADAQRNVALGNIYLDIDVILLKETVIETKAIEIQIKGDTVEYNADSYKVQETAVVEDLLKKMPGVEVDSDGKISVNGKEVKKILVDGKEFFSDDPKVASKNLPAKMVNKLQVVDRKSDMSIMTGFDDGDEETIINLTVKPGMKQGWFGNAFAGTGSKDRYEANGMVNYMRNSTQVSVLGGVNNTNNAGFSDIASSMFSSGRPRGLNFGGSNGVAKSISGGLNFATEYSDKLKWNGNLRYGSVDNDVISTQNTLYTGRDKSSITNRWGNNKSENMGLDLRFEWSLDSLTKIIFRPSVQYNTSNNMQTGDEMITDSDSLKGSSSESDYFSEGKGTRLNGSLEISRTLNKKGRVLSVRLSGGLNDSDDDGLNNSKIMYNDPAKQDSILKQQFFQDDKSRNWSAYLSYVEPLGKNNFLQLTYNIRNNNSETDKKTYSLIDPNNPVIDNNYTRNVQNDFLNQNISLNFKSIREKFDYTLGVGLEPSSSKTDIVEPDKEQLLVPRKSFLSFAPNFLFNYKWSKTQNLRIDYRGTTNQPSTLQLYDGITSNDGLNTTRGNPNLRPSFANRISVRYQKSDPQRASMMMLSGGFNFSQNDIVSVSTWNDDNGRDNTYRNINGNMSGNLRFMVNTPLRNKKFSISTMTFANYSRSNTFINEEKNAADMYQIRENIGLQFRSDKFDFAVRGNITFNSISNSINKNNNQDVYNYGGNTSFTYYLPFDFTIESDMNYSTNSGYSDGFKQDEWLWNASIAKQVLRNKAGTIRFKMYDILKERSNVSRQTYSDRIVDATTNTISSYFMVHFIYKFQIFGGGAKSSDMQMDGERGGGRGMRMHRGV